MARAQTAALQTVADLAPTLSESELRLILELTRRGLTAPDFTFRASSRDLAKSAKCSRPHMLTALDSLSERGLILCRRGTTTKASAFRLTFMDTLQMGGATVAPPLVPHGNHPGPIAGPPLVPPGYQPGSPALPPLVPHGNHPGSSREPLPTENTLFPLDPPPLDISIDPITDSIDRLQVAGEPPPTPNDSDPPALREAKSLLQQLHTAKPANFPTQELDHVRMWLSQLMRKYGPNGPNPKVADEWIAAQLLTIAPVARLTQLFYDLQCEDRNSLANAAKYAYFVTLAAQRLRGISPTALRQARQLARSPLTIAHRQPNPGAAAAEAQNSPAPFDTAALIAGLMKSRSF